LKKKLNEYLLNREEIGYYNSNYPSCPSRIQIKNVL